MKREVTILQRESIDRLLGQCGESFTGTRDRFLIALLYRTGMRVSEALGLELSDVRVESGELMARIRKPKGYAREKSPSAPRELLVDDRTAGYWRRWLEHRGIASGPLFTNESGTRLTRQYVGQMLARRARRAGVEGRIHPHALRHAFAHAWLWESPDFAGLMGALGHSRLDTTVHYAKQIGCQPHVIQAMKRRAAW